MGFVDDVTISLTSRQKSRNNHTLKELVQASQWANAHQLEPTGERRQLGNYFKLLGVSFDSSFTFKVHADKVLMKTRQAIRAPG